jgi:hypothetical protein
MLSPGASLVAIPAAARDAVYPAFSWDTVPCAVDIVKYTGDFSASEIAFLARHFSYVSISAGQACGLQPRSDPETEIGFARAALALKRANPSVKILFYWNSRIFIPLYASSKSFDPRWGTFRPGTGAYPTVVFDTSIRDFRRWWIDAGAAVIAAGDCDGAFIDGIVNTSYDPSLHDMLSGLRDRVRAVSGKEALIISNQEVQPPVSPLSYFDELQGQMFEPFDVLSYTTPDAMRSAMLGLAQIARAGKIVHFKAWPGFTFLNPSVKNAPYSLLAGAAKAAIEFPLACFLAIAERYSYFHYSWGYTNLAGSYLLEPDMETVDQAWYPELRRRLGAPLGDATLDGYTFTRSFEYANVTVDVEQQVGRITWLGD